LLFVTTKLRFEQEEDVEVLVAVPLLVGLEVVVVPLLVGVEVVLVELLEVLVDVDELEVDVVPDEAVDPEPPVRSTIKVSMRVEQPKEESDPSFPSQ
jgi:hypothetical protein